MTSRIEGDSSRLAGNSPPFPRRIELAVSLGEDHRLATGQLVRGCDVADRTVKTNVVVVRHKIGDDSSRVLQTQGRLDSDALL